MYCFYRFAGGDLAFCAALYGHIGSFVTLYRCVLCECPKEDFKKMFQPKFRTLENIRENALIYQNEYVSTANASIKRELYIRTKGISNEAIIKIPVENFVPSPLHILQG